MPPNSNQFWIVDKRFYILDSDNVSKFSAQGSLTSQKGIVDPKIIIGGIIVLVVIFFLTTGKFNFSATRTDQETTPSTDQTKTTEPSSQTKSYQNDQYGFGLQYPSNWSLKEGEGGYVATFLSPAESIGDKYFEFLGVRAVKSSKSDITTQEAADLWEQQTVSGTKEESNLQIVDRSASSVAGEEAKTVVFTIDLDKVPSKGSVTITVKNNAVYIFQYFAEESKYDKYLPDIEAILSSVSL